MSLVSCQDEEGSEHKEDCVSCIMYGFKWCGRYSHLFQKTKCAPEIEWQLCKVQIASEDVTKCYNKELNPVYEGRPEPAWVAAEAAVANGESAEEDTGIWDNKCTTEIQLKWDDLQAYREVTHKVKRGKFCLITINNFSGRNHTINVIEETDNEKMELYRLDNTDEMQWNTFKFLEAKLKADYPDLSEEEMHDT